MRSPGPVGGDLLARRYRLIDRVGAGGMSVVWRARDEVLDRLVAVKWLGAELADDELFRDLVRREAWATARIKHPAVAAVYDYGEVADRDGQSLAYVVMEMLDGESLADRLQRGPLPWREAVSIGAEVADALATAHEQGVVHRDISPDNVMLTSSGLRVFDFGIAAPIGEPDDDSTGSTFGTPAYVAPERLDGQPAQTATDVYSLGVLMFEMLTGRPPFPEDTWDPDAPARERIPPRLRGPAGLPPAVARLCQRCLAHDAAQRPPAREVADRLAAYTHPWWRGRVAVAAVAAGVVTAAAVIALVSWGPRAPTGTTTPTHGAPAASAPGLPVPPAGSPPAVSATPAGTPPVGTVTVSPGPAVTVTITTAPPVASVPVEQALDDVRAAITGTGLPADIAQDLSQQLENSIAQPLAANPSADVRLALSTYRDKILQRSNELDADGKARMSTDAKNTLLAKVDQLSAALGYS
jgi:serine/threonine-protein kinase